MRWKSAEVLSIQTILVTMSHIFYVTTSFYCFLIPPFPGLYAFDCVRESQCVKMTFTPWDNLTFGLLFGMAVTVNYSSSKSFFFSLTELLYIVSSNIFITFSLPSIRDSSCSASIFAYAKWEWFANWNNKLMMLMMIRLLVISEFMGFGLLFAI